MKRGPLPPRRKVVSRVMRGPNRLLTLECGHERLVGFKSKGMFASCLVCDAEGHSSDA